MVFCIVVGIDDFPESAATIGSRTCATQWMDYSDWRDILGERHDVCVSNNYYLSAFVQGVLNCLSRDEEE